MLFFDKISLSKLYFYKIVKHNFIYALLKKNPKPMADLIDALVLHKILKSKYYFENK
ncbi:MAG: hypothetical protein KIPDCIKN_03465 [Haliscomenobacter sp.]|nr:hypothetical protein [Haliscomenobacter sp.]